MGLCARCGQIDQDRDMTSYFGSLALLSSIDSNQAARDRLEMLTSEIAVLSAHLKKLWAHREILQTHLDNISYPVLTLPTEITTEIFLRCLPKGAQESRRRIAPLLLGGICQDWRKIALGTPRLWRALRLTLDRFLWRPHILPECLGAWLARSDSQPLKIVLRYDDKRSEPSPEAIRDIILQHAHRWEDVELVLPHADFLQIFGDFSGSFPRLKKLELCESEFGIRIPSCSFQNLQNSSELRELVIDGDILNPLPTEFPWAQLTRFHGFGVTFAQGCEVLRLTPLLEECTLDLKPTFLDNIPPTIERSPLTLPHVHSLKLFKAGMMFDGFGLLAFLTLPALKELHLAVDHNNVAHFLLFMSRSACVLSRLRASISMDEPHFAQCLAMLPNLAELSLKFELRSLPLRLAAILNRNNRYLPQLISLRIIGLGTEQNIGYQPLADMLESRNVADSEGTARLQVFELRFHAREIGPPDPAVVLRFQVLEKQGMSISVKLASGVQLP
ncbi:hypothetical protein B0H11DRAFT_782548 [Mycena galericulata]|nr:hypothetical protein B0H11DRAFT_782548 [Mycena galericulata]